ncbi:hypothetical protein BXZ70DRAFT_735115 [Cristinia sonorae]|uniref:Uncharacterized protein n=1 Tax=Cristinia sonorae TaxID=1940300 RepID=A0A8K0USV8_9AGAR|nr:hypothetical protein BXZ70DRAFT_735115 [Cristinia sonorae]
MAARWSTVFFLARPCCAQRFSQGRWRTGEGNGTQGDIYLSPRWAKQPRATCKLYRQDLPTYDPVGSCLGRPQCDLGTISTVSRRYTFRLSANCLHRDHAGRVLGRYCSIPSD